MLISFLVVMGIFSFFRIGVDLFPRSDPATIYVQVRLPGASPEEVTSQVVMPLEEAVASVSGIDEMRAMVSEGSANLTITFVLERDISQAADDVREKVSGAMRDLPPNVLPPVVQKADPDSDPVITLVVSGQRSTRELTEISDKQIRRALETVDGVAGVDITGGQKRQINVFLNLDKLSGYSLTAQDVEHALQTENIEAPGGRIVRGPTEVGVRTLGRVEEVPEFNNIIVKNVAGSPIRIRDIGHAEDGTQERRSFANYKGKPAIVMEIRRQTGTNTVQVVDGIKARVAMLRRIMPPGVRIDEVKNQADYIRNSVKSLEEHLVLGSLLASMIVWLFIRNWRTVLISSIAIPDFGDHHVHAHPRHGFHAEFDDAAGADAGRRHRDRRRHHRSGKHLPLHRGEGCAADAGGHPGDARDFDGGAGHHDFAGHHFHPHRVHDGLRQALREPVRLDHGHVHPGFHAGGLHADAVAERAHAEEEPAQGKSGREEA